MTIEELEREIASLRQQLAAKDAVLAKLVEAQPSAAPAPYDLPWPGVWPPVQPLIPTDPFKFKDHGGMCACPQCCPPIICGVAPLTVDGGINIGGPQGTPHDSGLMFR